ncbi:MAG: hypothetical protein GY772_01785, partial [bacterium]|nr:hypothetical protein [bacterium]
MGNLGYGNAKGASGTMSLLQAPLERLPPTIKGWGVTWVKEAKNQRIPFQVMPEGAPWFAVCPDPTGRFQGPGAKATPKVQGPGQEVVGKAAQRKYLGRQYTANRRDLPAGAEMVDFYRRGLLDEPEPDRNWAPAWFHELPIYQPVTREYISKHTWMDRVEFQGWPREMDETYTLMPRNPYQHEWRTLLRSCLVIEGAYVKRTTSASLAANMVNVVVRCTVCGTPFWG